MRAGREVGKDVTERELIMKHETIRECSLCNPCHDYAKELHR